MSRAATWALEDWPGIKHLVVAGGVAANQLLRSKLQVGSLTLFVQRTIAVNTDSGPDRSALMQAAASLMYLGHRDILSERCEVHKGFRSL